MRKVILSMQVSLDGFVAGPNGELEWVFERFDGELTKAIGEALSEVDTMLMGKANYLEQAAYWPSSADELAPIVNGHQKVVFSSTLKQLNWANSRLATGTPAEEIAALKQESGGTIGVSGGASFARSLLRDGLLDELRLTVHPVALGAGIRLFAEPQQLNVISSRVFDTGVVVHTFRPVPG
jgi:dihydrofolate reductase